MAASLTAPEESVRSFEEKRNTSRVRREEEEDEEEALERREMGRESREMGAILLFSL